MAVLHKHHRTVQHLLLESPCVPSTLSSLHVQIFEEDTETRLDVIGWDSAMHNGSDFYYQIIYVLNAVV